MGRLVEGKQEEMSFVRNELNLLQYLMRILLTLTAGGVIHVLVGVDSQTRKELLK